MINISEGQENILNMLFKSKNVANVRLQVITILFDYMKNYIVI